MDEDLRTSQPVDERTDTTQGGELDDEEAGLESVDVAAVGGGVMPEGLGEGGPGMDPDSMLTPDMPPDQTPYQTDPGQQTADRGQTPAMQNPEKDPADWVTGDEPMTGPQRSYLETLSREAGEPFDESLSKAEASRRIDELQHRTGRGQSS
jgi:hypothetical protein